MLSKNEVARIFGENAYLTTCVSQYTKQKFPPHTIETLEGIYQRVVGIVNATRSNQYGVLGFMGLPGSGKTNKIDEIEFKITETLGMYEGESEADFFSYHHDDGTHIGVGGYKGISGRMGTFHGDNFFRALGDNRRGVMLQDEKKFRAHWGRNADWFRTVRSVFAGVEPDTRLYFATPDERESKKPRGRVQVSNTPHSGGKNIILLEGVNVGYCMDKVQRLMHSHKVKIMKNLQFTKILFDTSPEYSIIKVLRRDRDAKNYSFEDILLHRIRELFYILPVFIYPALRDKSTIVLQRKVKHIPFTDEEKDEIMRAIYFAQSTYQYSSEFNDRKNELAIKQKKFAQKLLSNLEKIMEALPTVSEKELSDYTLQRGKK